MTDRLARLYTLVVGVLVFFVAWVAVAAHPWAPRPARDPRVVAIAAREQRIQRESLVVRRLVERRWAAYRVQLRARQHAIASARARRVRLAAAAPSVRVVTLPPLVVTRTS
jgi:hypothetical protein